MRNRRLNRGNNQKLPLAFVLILLVAIILMFALYLFVPLPNVYKKYILLLGVPVVTAIGIYVKVKFF